MNDLLSFPNGTDRNLEQVIARQDYLQLRDKLVALQSASDPDASAIDRAMRALEKAQLAYKATHGLIGNNPTDDETLGST